MSPAGEGEPGLEGGDGSGTGEGRGPEVPVELRQQMGACQPTGHTQTFCLCPDHQSSGNPGSPILSRTVSISWGASALPRLRPRLHGSCHLHSAGGTLSSVSPGQPWTLAAMPLVCVRKALPHSSTSTSSHSDLCSRVWRLWLLLHPRACRHSVGLSVAVDISVACQVRCPRGRFVSPWDLPATGNPDPTRSESPVLPS